MAVKNMKNQRGRIHYLRPRISGSVLNGKSEEEYKEVWGGSCKAGILYILHKDTNIHKPLCMKDIGLRIGYGRGTVKNNLRSLREESIYRTSIEKMVLKGCSPSTFFYFNNPPLKKIPFNEILRAHDNTFYKKDPRLPNTCEADILDICLESYPGMFEYTGSQINGKKVGPYWPDIMAIGYPIIIEHYGPHHFIPERMKADLIRLKYLLDAGYKVMIIKNYDPKQRNKIKKQIEEFVNYALQDLQQLVI